MASEANNNSQTPSIREIASRLANVHVGVRAELQTTRHVFRGEVSYVIQDPVTFQSHALTTRDYQVFVAISADRCLSATFDKLVDDEILDESHHDEFFEFVFTLHQLGFLSLPISNDKTLYQRLVRKKQKKKIERILGVFFLRIPLWNPDAFLNKTVRFARPIFSTWFFLFWLVLMAVGCFVAVQRWSDLAEPLSGLMAAKNLLIMWALLICLKVFHEFGHAFACKHYGGCVPEMGAYLILMTPCAYVDATASWGFPQKRKRIIVALAGMYIESFLALFALLVWCTTSPGLAHSIAYQTLFLASITTIGFNINPLMRYDGYYILADWLEIPNLRARARNFMMQLVKRVTLGLQTAENHLPFRLRATLTLFGIASTIYRLLLMMIIAALLTAKFQWIGLALAGLYVGSQCVGAAKKTLTFLWFSRETSPIRSRAVMASALILLVVPAAILFIPAPSRADAIGVVGREHETTVHVGEPGRLVSIDVHPGQRVRSGRTIASLENDTLDETLARAQADVDATSLRIRAGDLDDPAVARQERMNLAFHQQTLRTTLLRSEELTPTANRTGWVIDCVRPQDLGRVMQPGEPIATIASGSTTITVLLSAEEINATAPFIGKAVECRSFINPSVRLRGTITSITPQGTRLIEEPVLTLAGGGSIPVNPQTHEAVQPYFPVTITLRDADAELYAAILRHGARAQVGLEQEEITIGERLYRSFVRFTNRLGV